MNEMNEINYNPGLQIFNMHIVGSFNIAEMQGVIVSLVALFRAVEDGMFAESPQESPDVPDAFKNAFGKPDDIPPT